MELENKFNIEQFLNLDDYATDTRLSRRKGAGSTQEFFTPYSIVKRMCEKIPNEDWSDPDKTFLEPCFGNGQFIIYILYNRIMHGVHWKRALETIYGLELMNDNVLETYLRIYNLLDELDTWGIIKDYEYHDVEWVMEIMKKNLICHDFFTWNFEEWREMTEDEIKEANKKKK